MSQANWKRVKESEIKEHGGMLPAKVVLEHNPEDHSYRTFLETITGDGELGFQSDRYFCYEDEALDDFDQRMGRL
jgi:hypothetical protein